MDKIIVEVGSTCTKIDKFNGKNKEIEMNIQKKSRIYSRHNRQWL